MASKATKLTPKQEKFCRRYVQHGVGSRAYRESFDVSEDTAQNTCYVEASVLLANPKISQRVSELYEKIANVTVKEVVQGFRQVKDRAMELDDLSPANTALSNLGRHKNMFAEDAARSGDIHIHFAAELKGVL